MDSLSTWQLYQSKLFTDVRIILQDHLSSESITMDLHKCILYSSGSKYFQKLLTTNFKEKDKSELIIQVPNTNICKDIIESFYHKSNENYNAEYMINYVKCCYFFSMSVSSKKLFDIPSPIPMDMYNDWIELLLMSSVDLSSTDIDTIIYKLPDDYDINDLPLTVVEKIILYKNYLWIKHKNDHRFYRQLYPQRDTITTLLEANKKIYPDLTIDNLLSLVTLTWSKTNSGLLLSDYITNNHEKLQCLSVLSNKDFVENIIANWRQYKSDYLNEVDEIYRGNRPEPRGDGW